MNTTITPWYRQAYVWLVILFPLSAVIGGIITITLAIKSDDGLVVDDYYKKGKAINQVIARDKAAVARNIQASIVIATEASTVDAIVSGLGENGPSTILLQILHPTMPGRDQSITLAKGVNGHYRGVYQPLTEGNWLIQLETESWRLNGSAHYPEEFPLQLTPR